MGNIENSAHNEHIMIQEQTLDPSKLEETFNAKNKPLPKPTSTVEEKDFIKRAKIEVLPEY